VRRLSWENSPHAGNVPVIRRSNGSRAPPADYKPDRDEPALKSGRLGTSAKLVESRAYFSPPLARVFLLRSWTCLSSSSPSSPELPGTS
jgi:hypothetical protein